MLDTSFIHLSINAFEFILFVDRSSFFVLFALFYDFPKPVSLQDSLKPVPFVLLSPSSFIDAEDGREFYD